MKQMQNVLEYRYPNLHTVEPQTQLSPRPSVSGFHFALCAATLPLLRTKDTKMMIQIISIVRAAMPFVVEHSENFEELRGSDVFDENHIYSLNVKRLQHLLSRFDQVSILINIC
jgi:hypothetical protein